MANMMKLLFEQEFTDTDSITVVHNLNKDYINGIRVIVGSQARPDLIKSIAVSPSDPMNSLVVNLHQISSGNIQIIGTDYVRVGQASTTEASTSLVFGSQGKQGASSLPSQTTSSSEWVRKIKISRTFESGLYRIGLSYIWSASAIGINRYFNARLLVDDEEVYLHKEGARAPDNLTPTAFFLNKELPAGEHSLTLEFRMGGNSMSVSMSNANIEIWRTVNG